MEVLIVTLSIFIGTCIGAVISNLYFHAKTKYGTLRIDHSNPEKDIYRIEFDNLDDIDKKKHVYLKIDNNANLSQK